MQVDLTRIDREITACRRSDYDDLWVSNAAARIVMRTARELSLILAYHEQARRKRPEWWGVGEFLR
jgi:hypothetical protein